MMKSMNGLHRAFSLRSVVEWFDGKKKVANER